MIREVQRVLSLFSNFFNDDTTFEPFPTRFENTNECFRIVYTNFLSGYKFCLYEFHIYRFQK